MDEVKKMCPITYSATLFAKYACVEEKCAWWDSEHQCCAVLSIKKVLR